MAVVDASAAQVRELAREIVARPEYARWQPQHIGWLTDLLREIDRWLSSWTDLSRTRPVLFAAILTALLVIGLLLVAHVVYSLRIALRAGHPPAPQAPPAAPSFIDEADALARAGRLLEAAHRLQLGVLALLLRCRVIELARSEPNRTLRRRLRQAALPQAERRELLSLLDRFEERWFRDRIDDPELYTGWRQLYQRLNALYQP